MRLALLVIGLWSTLASAQCSRDTDCKGNRVCEGGVCIESDAPIAEAPKVAPVAADPSRAARLVELNFELREMRESLDGAGLVGPIIKLVLAGGAAVGGVLFFSFAQSSTTTDLRSNNITFGAIFSGVAVALAVWGGLQLGLRLHARSVLPEKIAATEAQITALSQ